MIDVVCYHRVIHYMPYMIMSSFKIFAIRYMMGGCETCDNLYLEMADVCLKYTTGTLDVLVENSLGDPGAH